jgi:hypothetical protein
MTLVTELKLPETEADVCDASLHAAIRDEMICTSSKFWVSRDFAQVAVTYHKDKGNQRQRRDATAKP